MTKDAAAQKRAPSSRDVDFIRQLKHNGVVLDKNWNNAEANDMAEGTLLEDFIGEVEKAKIPPPDLYQILSLARRRRERSKAQSPGQVEAQSQHQQMAEALVPDFESFYKVAVSVGLTPLLIELAIIDNESLERARDSKVSETVNILRKTNEGYDLQPEFVSVLAAFDEFGDDDLLVQAWHQATVLVVNKDGQSLVGTPETYRYAYIWEHLTPYKSDSNKHSKSGVIQSGVPPRTDIIPLKDKLEGTRQISLPVFYAFGELTAKRVEDPTCPEGVQRVPINEPKGIANSLATHLCESTANVFGEDKAKTLHNSILIIVPFTRTRLYQSDGLTPVDSSEIPFPQRSADQEGGGVFLLCHCDISQEARTNDSASLLLKEKIRKAAGGIGWLMIKSARLEARQERDNTREEDLAQYAHLVRRSWLRVNTSVRKALEYAEDLEIPRAMSEALNSAAIETERLQNIGDIARQAFLLKSGRANLLSLEWKVDVLDFESEIKEKIEEVIKFVKYEVLPVEKRPNVATVGFDWDYKLAGVKQIRTSKPYISSLFDELFKNALEHGGYSGQNNAIKVKLYSCPGNGVGEGAHVILRVANPVRDERALTVLKDQFKRRRFYLGLSHIELLAQVFNLPLPLFAVEKNEVRVYCFIGIAL